MREQGVSWEWIPAGDGTYNLKTITAILPAIRVDNAAPHRSGQKTFFNSVIAAYTGWNDSRNQGSKAVLTGDGEYCDPQAMEDAVQVMNELCVAFPWEQGDVLLLDNRLAMHARRPFSGKRRILASLCRDYAH